MKLIVFVLVVFLWQEVSGEKIDKKVYPYINWETPHSFIKTKVEYIITENMIKTKDNRKFKLSGVDIKSRTESERVWLFFDKQLEDRNVVIAISKKNESNPDKSPVIMFYTDRNNRIRCFNWELIKNGICKAQILADDSLCAREKWEKMSESIRNKTINDYYYIAKELLLEGLQEESIKIYQEGIKKFPDEKGYYDNLASLYSSMNLPGFEADAYLAYLERKPECIETRRKLALVYEKMSAVVPFFAKKDYTKKALIQWEIVSKAENKKFKKYKEEAEQHIMKILLSE